MASGEVHGIITRILILPTAAAAWALTHEPITAVSAAAGCAAGLFLEPDLDVDSLTASEWRLLRHGWLWPVGLVWFAFWLPYAKVFPHRSPWTHFPVLGTAVRLAYLVMAALIVLSIAGKAEVLVQWAQTWNSNTLSMFCGLVVSDTAHWVADWHVWRVFDWRFWAKRQGIVITRKRPYGR